MSCLAAFAQQMNQFSNRDRAPTKHTSSSVRRVFGEQLVNNKEQWEKAGLLHGINKRSWNKLFRQLKEDKEWEKVDDNTPHPLEPLYLHLLCAVYRCDVMLYYKQG